jgi:NAD(P) transhydrogenase
VSAEVPLNNRNIISSDSMLNLPEIPKTLIVVGGGVIGAEYASMFAALGVRVILIEKRPRLLEFADSEMVEALCYHCVTAVSRFDSVKRSRASRKARRCSHCESRKQKKVSGDALLYSVGRQGNVDDLNLAAAGLDADSRGRITVDHDYRTKTANIFAVGDVIGFPSLASVSMEQGRLAVGNAFGAKVHSDPSNYPFCIYTIPEISFVGKTKSS